MFSACEKYGFLRHPITVHDVFGWCRKLYCCVSCAVVCCAAACCVPGVLRHLPSRVRVAVHRILLGALLQKSIVPFGAFVDIGSTSDGLVHISEIADQFVRDVNDFVSRGEQVDVVLLKVVGDSKLSLSMKAALARALHFHSCCAPSRNRVQSSCAIWLRTVILSYTSLAHCCPLLALWFSAYSAVKGSGVCGLPLCAEVELAVGPFEKRKVNLRCSCYVPREQNHWKCHDVLGVYVGDLGNWCKH